MKDHVPEGWHEGDPRTQGAVRPKLDPWKETIPEITKGSLRKAKDFLKNAVVKSKDVDKYESVNKEIQEFNNAISMIQGHQSDFSSEEQTKYNDLFQKFYNATKKAINSFGDMTSPLGREERQKARRDLKKFNNTIKAVKFELCWAKLQNSSTIDEAFPELAEELTSRFSLNLDQKSQLQQLPELWKWVSEASDELGGYLGDSVENSRNFFESISRNLRPDTRKAFKGTTLEHRENGLYRLLAACGYFERVKKYVKNKRLERIGEYFTFPFPPSQDPPTKAFSELKELISESNSLNLDQKSQLQQLPELWRSVNEGLREKPVEKYQDDLKLAAKGLKYHTRNAFESTTNDERRESFYALLTVYSILEYINSHSIFEETR